MLAQLIFRGTYSIRAFIREGNFDYFVIQPTPVLFRVMFNNVDFLDVVTVIPVIGMVWYVMTQIPGAMTPEGLLLYVFLLANGLVIAMGIHTFVAAIGVWTQELENTIWIYRDLMTLGRFPADIYGGAIRGALTFLIPIAVMITFPVKALLGKLPVFWMCFGILIGLGTFILSQRFWHLALSRYTSASS